MTTAQPFPTVASENLPPLSPTSVAEMPPSRADTWSNTTAFGMDDECSGRSSGWDAASESNIAIPKLEPVEDRVNLSEVSEAPRAPRSTANVLPKEPKAKRPRGRPRKHPVAPAPTPSKLAKGRSKTGCITCRKRKKKCDEAKPRCMNCEKNAVVCEGYHEKKLWRGGKDRSDEDVFQSDAPFHFTVQSLFHGVTDCEDRIFWKHYCVGLSNVLTVEGETRNAFKDIILPLANQHQGVMHSILAMSSKHIDYCTPYGSKLLEQNPTVSRESLESRSSYHHDKAIESFHADVRLSSEKQDVDHETVLRARYAQMLCLLIGTRIEGNSRGDHRIHLRGYQLLIQHSPPKDPVFLAFITEFFQYHIFADELIRHPSMDGPRLVSQEWLPSIPTEHPRLLGVADGLLSHLPQISAIKDTIRRNISLGVETRVDYHLLWRAQEIQEAIEQWSPQWPAGDKRHNVGLIYKHMMFLHLFRTIYPPTESDQQRPASYFYPGGEPVSPAASRRPSQPSRPLTASSSASSPGDHKKTTFAAQMTVQQRSPPGSRNPSRTSSLHETDQNSLSTQQRPLSPPPSRRASHHDARIAIVVEESLAMMESFKPCEPALALLLMPCEIIGAACFDSSQRERTRTVIKSIRGYTGLRNCDRVCELLEEVWSLMDEGDWLSVWDWQSVARGMEVDFLCT